MPKTKTNAVDLLIEDHRKVETLFEQYESDPLAATRRREIVDQITKELSIHAAIEEQVFYPAVKMALGGEGSELVDESLHEHREVKELLAALESMDHASGAFDERVRALIRNVRHHVGEEEGEMFPRFRDAIDAQRLEQIGAALEKAKKVAPTRPHPHAPARPPANVVAGPAVAAVDRMRDTAHTMPAEQRSLVTTGLKVVGVLATGIGLAVGTVKFVRSRRKPPTRVEQLRGIATQLGGKALSLGGKARDLGGKINRSQAQSFAGKALVVGGKARELGGKALTEGADAIARIRRRAS